MREILTILCLMLSIVALPSAASSFELSDAADQQSPFLASSNAARTDTLDTGSVDFAEVRSSGGPYLAVINITPERVLVRSDARTVYVDVVKISSDLHVGIVREIVGHKENYF